MKKEIYLFFVVFLFFSSCSNNIEYTYNKGKVFGTTYSLIYKHPQGKNLEKEILAELNRFSESLDNYNLSSIITRVNNNDPNVRADSYFKHCFNISRRVSKITDGAFDLTVAPLVNAWGFGFDESIVADSSKIDSLMQFIGYQKIRLEDNRVLKDKAGIKIDASAVAKGFGVDVVASILDSNNVENYLVEIGGEVRTKGVNKDAKIWRVGIDKPVESYDIQNRDLQEIITLQNKSLATSGNYRQFYEKDGVKYSHTINPKTGYPERSNLLSATVLANDCITADAFATAFMVMGLEKSIALANKLDSIEVFFIYSDSTRAFSTYSSEEFAKLICQD